MSYQIQWQFILMKETKGKLQLLISTSLTTVQIFTVTRMNFNEKLNVKNNI